MLVVVSACYWKPIARCIVLGMSESRAIDLRFSVGNADQVEVLLLKDDWKKPATNGLYIVPYDHYYEIIESRPIEGERAARIASLWSQQVFDPMIQALCHEPAYGLRFKRGSKLLWETSICFKCNNFTLQFGPFQKMTGFMGFDSRTEEAKALLKELEEILPTKQDG